MGLAIREESAGDVRVLALAGRLDAETAADLELAVADLRAAGARDFLLDLAEVGYVSSAGLRVLQTLSEQVAGSGSLRLTGLVPAVRKVFEVAGFVAHLAIYPDRAAALRGRAKIGSVATTSGKGKTVPVAQAMAARDAELAARVAQALGAAYDLGGGSAPGHEFVRRIAAALGVHSPELR